MYYVYVGKMLLPVAPSQIETSIGSDNKVYDLINEGETTVIKSMPLQEIRFEFLLPLHKYSFAHYKSGFIGASVFIEYLQECKEDKEPIQLIITRANGAVGAVVGTGASILGGVGITGGAGTFTNLKVTLEEYTLTESADNAGDYMVSASFKEYREPKLFELPKLAKLGASALMGAISTQRSTANSPAPKKVVKTHTVKKGETLWIIAKKYYGNGALYTEIASVNKIINPNSLKVGQILTLPVV